MWEEYREAWECAGVIALRGGPPAWFRKNEAPRGPTVLLVSSQAAIARSA